MRVAGLALLFVLLTTCTTRPPPCTHFDKLGLIDDGLEVILLPEIIPGEVDYLVRDPRDRSGLMNVYQTRNGCELHWFEVPARAKESRL